MRDRRYFFKAFITNVYSPYKAYIMPTSILIVSFILIVQFIIPQFQSFLYLRSRITSEREHLHASTQKLQVLSGINDDELDNDLHLGSSALPTDKDFISILNAISLAATKANVSLGDYSFQLGNLSQTSKDNNSLSSIQLLLTISSDIDGLVRFMKELAKSAPISEIDEVRVSTGNSDTVILTFYYKPVSSVSFDENQPIQPLSPQEKNLFNTLSLWQNPSQTF